MKLDEVNSLGYSLIELLVVMALFGLLMLIATQSLVLTLRSTNKSESLGKVRESVEFAVSVMERNIRNAKNIDVCPNPPVGTTQMLTFKNQDGSNGGYSCIPVGAPGNFALVGPDGSMTGPEIKITACSVSCKPNPGVPPSVNIKITAEDNTGLTGAENSQVTSETNIFLRQY
jgi:prepilin-type N-terminal cleavage/methylation domain-containing protein